MHDFIMSEILIRLYCFNTVTPIHDISLSNIIHPENIFDVEYQNQQ